jgi:hypothetical protein
MFVGQPASLECADNIQSEIILSPTSFGSRGIYFDPPVLDSGRMPRRSASGSGETVRLKTVVHP